MTNREVIKKWSKGKSGKGVNLFTDGCDLYSYGLIIGFTGDDRLKYVYNHTAHIDMDWLGNKVKSHFISNTTSRHISLAREVGYAVNPI